MTNGLDSANKTQAQRRLERKYQRPIEEIIMAELDAHRYQKNITTKVAYRLDINQGTFKIWCSGLGIDIEDYRYASRDEIPPIALPV